MITERTRLFLSSFIFVVLSCSAIRGDDLRAQLAIGEKPYFVGLPVPLEISVSGVEQNPTPKWRLLKELPDGVSLTLTNVSPQVSSRTIISNGRTIVDDTDTTFVFSFRLISQQSGSIRIGVIEIDQNGNTSTVNVPPFSFAEVPNDPDMIVEVELPEGPIYVGQRSPISIVWGYAGDISRVRHLRFSSPFFDQFELEDQQVDRNDTFAAFTSKKGDVDVRADRRQERRDGQQYELLVFNRTMIANRAGSFEVDQFVVDIDYITRFRRSVFGSGRRPIEAEHRRGKSDPFSIEVLPLPSNSPPSFAGAIGSGFRLDVDVLGNTIVNVGDPIKLKLTVTGNGNIAEIGLPPLSNEEAFDPRLFLAAQGQLAGTSTGNTKEFVTQVRVVDPTVNQIPALAYSWFDPDIGEYKTVRSEPRSITVGAAKRISSADVVSAAQSSDSKTVGSTGSTSDASLSSFGIDLSGADLSINIDVDQLIKPARQRRNTVAIAIYAFAATLVGLTLIGQTRKVSAEARDSRSDAVHAAANRVARAARDRNLQRLVAALRDLLPTRRFNNSRRGWSIACRPRNSDLFSARYRWTDRRFNRQSSHRRLNRNVGLT